MTVGHVQSESNPRYVSMEKFAADVAARINGHGTVEGFGNGQMFPPCRRGYQQLHLQLSMGGENQTFDDIDVIPTTDLK